jgi:hypothetical protein
VKGGATIATTVVNGTSAAPTLSTEGITTFHFRATDSADNDETTVETRVVKLDKTAPTVNLALPATNAAAPVGPQANDPATGTPIKVYLLGQTPVRVTYSCSDAMSGLVNCTGTDGTTPKATNAQLDTNTIGLHTFTVTSTDVAGNTTTKAFQYRVVYNLCLGYDPTQKKNITSTVVLIVQVCNAQNTNLSAASIVLTGIAADNNGALLSPNGPGGSNPSFTFMFDPKLKNYTYNLKTDNRYVKAPAQNWLNFKISTDPVTTTGVASDQVYLNKLYRAYFLLK